MSPVFASKSRVASRGQVWTAALDWDAIRDQLAELDCREMPTVLPHTGATLAAIVKVRVKHGLIDFNKYLKDATVRRQVVVELIRRLKESGDEDYADQNMDAVRCRAQSLADTDEATIPKGILEMLDTDATDGNGDPNDLATDKAATPAERPTTSKHLAEHMHQLRPNVLFVQRDTDALKKVESSRIAALAQQACPELHLTVGSTLINQFEGDYIPRVFKLTFPWRIGGPDLFNRVRPRRPEGAPRVTLNMYTAMIARRVEAQLRMDQHLFPAVWSLCFATQVNTKASLAMRRNLQAGQHAEEQESKLGAHTQALYGLLHRGQYIDDDGKRKPIAGDISKLVKAANLTHQQKALLHNYYFMSAPEEHSLLSLYAIFLV